MKKYIPSLHGLRALSIAVVIFHHLNALGIFGNFNPPYPFSLLLDGNFAVKIFFVSTAFPITTLLIEEENRYGKISIKNFYIRRVFRIFPAYYFVLLVYFVLQLSSLIHLPRGSWLSSIFYYRDFVREKDAETAHFWSLSVEEHFYLLWPLIFTLSRKLRGYFATGIILLVFACRLAAYNHLIHFSMVSDMSFFFQRVDAIMIGCLFAIHRKKIAALMNKPVDFRFIGFLLFIVLINTGHLTEWNMTHKLHLGLVFVPLGLGSPVGTVTNILIAFGILFSIEKKNKWSAFLNLPFMTFIGKLSYSLYLWQQLFIMSSALGWLNKTPINLVCAIAAALLSYYLIERPFLRLKDRVAGEFK